MKEVVRDAARNIVFMIYLEFVDDIPAVTGREYCLFRPRDLLHLNR
jgi:hypothetical protein